MRKPLVALSRAAPHVLIAKCPNAPIIGNSVARFKGNALSIRQIFSNCALYSLAAKNPDDPRGLLTVIEGNRDIPFDIARVYFLTQTPPDVARGFHAHRALEQFAVCAQGSCTFAINDGRNKESIVLSGPGTGLYMGPMLWHEMRDFSADCALIVFASAPYDEADYIRSRTEFQELVA